MNELVPVRKTNQLYVRMQDAISKCYSVDDCEKIATQAAAISAYFRQIDDDESVRKFLVVKLRAWRRIGEIFSAVDVTDCVTQAAHARKVREAFKGDTTVAGMADATIYNALKLGRLPADFFERELGQPPADTMARHQPSVANMLASYARFMRQEWEATPEGQEELARRAEQAKEQDAKNAAWRAAEAARQAEEAAKVAAEKAKLREKLDQQYLDHQAMEMARAEVGFTMERRDREHMKEVLFLIKAPIHEILRQAAFDRRVTMQSILRAGLAMWLMANGYPADPDDMNLIGKVKKAA